MFEKNKRYKHRTSLDIDMYVYFIIEDTVDYITISAKWWNRFSKLFQPDSISTETIKIYRKDFDKWQEVLMK